LIYAMLVTLGAAAAAAATGFGFNLLGAPLLTFVYPADTVVETTLILGVLVSGILATRPEIRGGTDWRLVRRLFAGSLAGMPLGLTLLLWGHPGVLKILIAALTAVFAISMLAGFRPTVTTDLWQAVAAGALSGFLSTSTSLSGPPIVFFLLGQNQPKAVFRANIVPFIFLTTLASVALLVLARVVSFPTFQLALALFPVTLLGCGGGLLLEARLSDRGFERAVLGFLVIVGLLGIVSALG
jgi:uncharacterized membrane protein YfcA